MHVGYLVVGNMGQPMAGELLNADTAWQFTTSTRRRWSLYCCATRRGASPKELADQCEIVLVSLPTLAAFRAAVLGAEGLANGRAMQVLVLQLKWSPRIDMGVYAHIFAFKSPEELFDGYSL
jgi:3-hydroxyisobutyrate dehydrogenase-like beta-hydroxyacid dehydrogenase